MRAIGEEHSRWWQSLVALLLQGWSPPRPPPTSLRRGGPYQRRGATCRSRGCRGTVPAGIGTRNSFLWGGWRSGMSWAHGGGQSLLAQVSSGKWRKPRGRCGGWPILHSWSTTTLAWHCCGIVCHLTVCCEKWRRGMKWEKVERGMGEARVEAAKGLLYKIDLGCFLK